MTSRNLKRSKICKLHRADIWGIIYTRKKLTKFSKIKARRPNNKISIGNFKGIVMKRPKNTRKRKTRYGRSLKLKQRLINFYGSIKNFQFRDHLLKEKRHTQPTFLFFMSKLESRLDVIITRSNFVLSIYEARQLINHKKILVNTYLLSKLNSIIKPQNIVIVSDINKIKQTILKIPFIFKYCSKHLHINFITLVVGLLTKPQLKYLSFPFRFKVRRFLQMYKI